MLHNGTLRVILSRGELKIEVVNTSNRRVYATVDSVGLECRICNGKKTFANGQQASDVSDRLNCKNTRHITVSELCQLITSGHTWTPAVLNGSREDSNFVMAQLVALDFDGVKEGGNIVRYIPVEEVLDRCHRYNLPPCIGYYSFRHESGTDRFRLVWQFDRPVADRHLYKSIIQALMEVFCDLGMDKACSGASHMFFGTNKGGFLQEPDSVISIEQVFEGYCQKCYSDDPAHAKRQISSFSSRWGIGLSENGVLQPDILTALWPMDHYWGWGEESCPTDKRSQDSFYTCRAGENRAVPYIEVYICSAAKSPTSGLGSSEEGNPPPLPTGSQPAMRQHGYIDRGLSLDDICNNCQLCREINEGIRHPHQATFGCATSLLRVQGGEKFLRDGLKLTSNYNAGVTCYQIKKIKDWIAAGNKPMSCDNFCPYSNECWHEKNLLQQGRRRQGEVRKDSEVNQQTYRLTLNEAQKQMVDALEQAFADKSNDIHLIIAPAGLGKTHSLCKQDLSGIIVAAPTHKLISQIHKDLIGNRKDVLLVPELPEVSSEFKATVQLYYDDGAYKKACEYIDQYAKQLLSKTSPLTRPEQKLLEYVQAVKEIRETNRPVLTTHKRALLLHDTPHHTVVFDEDFLKLALNQNRVRAKDLDMLRRKACTIGDDNIRRIILPVLDEVLNSKESRPMPTPKTSKGTVEQVLFFILENCPDCTGDIVGLFKSDFFLYEQPASQNERKRKRIPEYVDYISVPSFPKCKTIVLSATAVPEMYEMAVSLKDPSRRVVKHIIGPVANRGQVIQCCEMSFSKRSMNTEEKLQSMLARIKPVVGDLPVLTFQKLTKIDCGLNTIKDAYFHNQLGLNNMSGQDLAVVGTPNLPSTVYLLVAAALGVNMEKALLEMKYKEVKWNGYIFDFMAFDDPVLQRIQLSMIQSELIQAVGRARAIRHDDVMVLVFSNLPLPDALIVSDVNEMMSYTRDIRSNYDLGRCELPLAA